jgi:hypothetical protein
MRRAAVDANGPVSARIALGKHAVEETWTLTCHIRAGANRLSRLESDRRILRAPSQSNGLNFLLFYWTLIGHHSSGAM